MRTMTAQLERPILSEDVVSFTDCRGRLAEYFEKTRTTHRPVVVTQNGRATTVIVNLADWEQAFKAWDEARLTREVIEDLRIGREQIARGEYSTIDESFERLRKEFNL